MRWPAALVLAWLAAGIAGAAPVWTRAASPHFEVFSTSGPRAAGQALDYFEEVRDFFEAFLSLPPSTRRATQVFLFSNEAEFAPYRASASVAAYYQPARDRDYIVMRDITDDAEPIIVHEYAHLALARSGATYPTWLSEGLAEFFSTMVPEPRKVRLGRAPQGRLATLKVEAMLPLARLLAVTRDSPEYAFDHAAIFYAESWALTHMLVAGERYQPRVDAFLSLVARGSPVSDALSRVYQKTVAEVDRDLRLYIARGFFRQLSVPHSMTVGAARSAASTVDPFIVNLALANMLAAGRGRETRARAAFESLFAERPRDAALAASRGLFELQSGHADAAETWLTRAIGGGSRDPMAHAELARLIESADPEKAAALLGVAAGIAPDDVAIRIRVAANLMARHKGAEALSETARIGKAGALPGDQRFLFYQVVANAHASLGNFDEAGAAAARVIENASNAEERRFAEQLRKDVSGPADITDMVRGRLRDMDCAGPVPILEVLTDAGTLRLALDDRAKVVLAGGAGSTDLDCGPQDRPLRIGFSRDRPPQGANGRVRFLDFR